jgi:enolase
MKIEQVIARELYDSQGYPTLYCEIILDSGQSVTALVPSGRSVGSHEAKELRDHEPRLEGRGVRKAIEMIEKCIAPVLVGNEPRAVELDNLLIELDGTPDKSHLGANTLLAVSMALYRAEALWHDIELYELFAALYESDIVTMPLPLLNVINGGLHAPNGLTIQECLIVPVRAPTFRASFEVATEAYHLLGKELTARGKSTAVGLEGGYAPHFSNDYEALDILAEVVRQINERQPVTCMMALDMAASQLGVQRGFYRWNSTVYTTQEMIEIYKELVEKYPLYSIEDPLGQDDWDGWQKLTAELGQAVQIVGDDLFVTDVRRISKGIQEKSATAAIIKPNQIGTITETLEAISLCNEYNLNPIVSHRSCDTEDTFIADLVVGTSAGQFKAGAPCRSERVAKYNRLLVIEDELTFIDEER